MYPEYQNDRLALDDRSFLNDYEHQYQQILTDLARTVFSGLKSRGVPFPNEPRETHINLYLRVLRTHKIFTKMIRSKMKYVPNSYDFYDVIAHKLARYVLHDKWNDIIA